MVGRIQIKNKYVKIVNVAYDFENSEPCETVDSYIYRPYAGAFIGVFFLLCFLELSSDYLFTCNE